MEHGFLRALWHNFRENSPGVFRSNHPGDVPLDRYAARGIRTILAFRGEVTGPVRRPEEENCAPLGLDLRRIRMAAREAPKTEALLPLPDVFDGAQPPFLMQCKPGADRTSRAGAHCLHHPGGPSVAEARRQMAPRFIHVRWTATGILDEVPDLCAARLGQGPIGLRVWTRTECDADEVTGSLGRRRWLRAAQPPEGRAPESDVRGPIRRARGAAGALAS